MNTYEHLEAVRADIAQVRAEQIEFAEMLTGLILATTGAFVGKAPEYAKSLVAEAVENVKKRQP